MKKILKILLIIPIMLVPMSAMAFDYTIDEETGVKLYQLPNGIKDEIIDGKLIKRISDVYVISIDTVGQLYKTALNNVDLITFNKSNFPNTFSSSDSTGTRWQIDGFSPKRDFPLDTETSIGLYYENNSNIALIVEKGKYDNYIEARNDLIEKGTKLIYQLETPEVYSIEPIKGHHKVKLLINEFSLHIKNIAIAISKTITEFFYNGESITTRGILFFAYVATVFCLSVLAIVFKRR